MTHLTVEQLNDIREPGVEPGTAAAREHLESCAHCRAELDRLHQRVARLRALPALRPARDRWPVVAAALDRSHRARRTRWVSAGSLALAASVALVLMAGDLFRPAPATAEQQIHQAMRESSALEGELHRIHPDRRASDLTTAQVASELEQRIADLDQQLQLLQLEPARPVDNARTLELWRQRVGLLDALVDVHLTHASNVGL
ncbi:MAG TPA: hypothetical protein VFU45_02610 [Gemmatimonadales bacterium]|nr:hypothetical protein [Gemmatimonadales bacterium]